VTSINAVRSAYGDAYYWDNAHKTLYLRVVSAETTFPKVCPIKIIKIKIKIR
jgi:hypothetical protein